MFHLQFSEHDLPKVGYAFVAKCPVMIVIVIEQHLNVLSMTMPVDCMHTVLTGIPTSSRSQDL